MDSEGADRVLAATSMEIIKMTFNRWIDLPSAQFDAVFAGTKECYIGRDGENHILLTNLGSDLFSPIARTDSHGLNGETYDADISFNTSYSTWDVLDFEEVKSTLLWRTSLHEIGHFIGLGHTSNVYALMHPISSPSRNDLHWDDIEGITFLYPAESLPDLIAVDLIKPAYFNPSDIIYAVAEFKNIGEPVEATVEVKLHPSDTPEIDTSITLGAAQEIFIDGKGPYQVGFGPFAASGNIGSLKYFGVSVDTSHSAFESDEDNNMDVFTVPVVDLEINGDHDLSGSVDYMDLFWLSKYWGRERIFYPDLRFDFGRRYYINEEDIRGIKTRWHNPTTP